MPEQTTCRFFRDNDGNLPLITMHTKSGNRHVMQMHKPGFQLNPVCFLYGQYLYFIWQPVGAARLEPSRMTGYFSAVITLLVKSSREHHDMMELIGFLPLSPFLLTPSSRCIWNDKSFNFIMQQEVKILESSMLHMATKVEPLARWQCCAQMKTTKEKW